MMTEREFKAIANKLESLVEEGEINEGDIIRIPNLSRVSAALLQTSYSENRSYEVDKEIELNPDKPGDQTYTLYLKYTGEKNA